MENRDASNLMDSYNDLSDSEKSKFKKRFNELLRFEMDVKKMMKARVKERVAKILNK